MDPTLELRDEKVDVREIDNVPDILSIWRHYKGRCYLVENIAVDAEDKHLVVCYSAIGQKDGRPYVRSVKEWNSPVISGVYTIMRFTKICDADIEIIKSLGREKQFRATVMALNLPIKK